MNNLFFDQLVQRIEGDRRAMNQAADIFRGMIDRKVWLRLTQQREIPADIDQLEEVFHQQQIFFRQVKLEGRWWTHCTGKLLAFMCEDDAPVILTPHFAGYSFIHPKTGQRYEAKHGYHLLKPEAFALCYPLPQRERTSQSSPSGRVDRSVSDTPFYRRC